MRKEINIYAFYKQDELIATGTVSEIAEICGISKSTVRFFGYQKYVNRVLNSVRSKGKILVKIEDMEIDW